MKINGWTQDCNGNSFLLHKERIPKHYDDNIVDRSPSFVDYRKSSFLEPKLPDHPPHELSKYIVHRAVGDV